MNPRATIAGLIVFACAAPLLVHAQFIRVSFTGPDNFVAVEPQPAPSEIFLGEVSRLDLFYAPSAAIDAGGGRFEFANAADAFWRMQLNFEELGDFTFTRPLTFLQIGEDSLSFEHLVSDPILGDEELSFNATFAGSISAGGQLPTEPLPPLAFGEGDLMLFLRADWRPSDTTDTFFVYGAGGFELASLQPVPEPSTYAAGALGLIALVWVLRRQRGVVRDPKVDERAIELT